MRIDWNRGSVSIKGQPIEAGDQNRIAPPLEHLFYIEGPSPSGKTCFRSIHEADYLGFSVDVFVEVDDGHLKAISLHFKRIEFFDFSVLESKIVQAVRRNSGREWVSEHPAKANLSGADWGCAEFSYDPKQGDLSLLLKYGAQCSR